MQIPVRVVLVATTHPGNIGAAARAMRTMGLRDLVLVRPRYFPHDDATARAAGADDVLAGARVADSLAEAIADCGYVAGASARLRSVRLPVVNPRDCAATAWRSVAKSPAAVVFGPEQSGLTNEDLGRCTELVHIPSDPEFSSLNLAMAVQVICYELRMRRELEMVGAASVPRLPSVSNSGSRGTEAAPTEGDFPAATAAELERFQERLESLLRMTGFLHPEHQQQIRLKLRRIFHRAALDRNELNILHGVLTALDPNRPRHGGEER